jgi:fatty-acid desaturase
MEPTKDGNSTASEVDVDSLPEEDRVKALRMFYMSRFLLILVFILFAFLLVVSGAMDQYTYASITVVAIIAYLTGKVEGNLLRFKR